MQIAYDFRVVRAKSGGFDMTGVILDICKAGLDLWLWEGWNEAGVFAGRIELAFL